MVAEGCERAFNHGWTQVDTDSEDEGKLEAPQNKRDRDESSQVSVSQGSEASSGGGRRRGGFRRGWKRPKIKPNQTKSK